MPRVMRRLGPDEKAAWRKVAATVRPIAEQEIGAEPEPFEPGKRAVDQPMPPRSAPPARQAPPSDTLDKSWDRKLARGLAAPDATLDLHGMTLAAAHGALNAKLAAAIGRGARLLLVVTGKPPAPERADRGKIRASIKDWLAASPHAVSIAAVRGAHGRHGGAGALYVVLRRPRPAQAKAASRTRR